MRNTWGALLAAGSLVVAPVAAAAQTTQVPAMSLHDALTYARAHQPSLRAAQARLAAARAATFVPRSEWLPQLGAAAELIGGTMNNTTASFVGVRTLDIPRIGATRVDPNAGWSEAYPSTLVGLGLRQQLFDFGRIAAQSALYDIDVELSRERADFEQLEVTLAVERTYYAVLAAKAVRTATEEAYQRARIRHDTVQAAVRGGMRAPIDLTRTDADLTRFDVERTRAQGAIDAAQAVFAAAVGSPELVLDAVPEAPAASENEALPPLGQALKEAQERDPAVRMAMAKLRQQHANTRAITMQLVPNLMLSASITGRSGGASSTSGPSGASGWLPETPNWDIAVVFTAPVFDGTVLAKRRVSQAQEEVARAEIDVLTRNQQAQIQRAYGIYTVAHATLRSLQAAAEAAQRNYDQANARFRAGLSNVVELADAESLRTDAEIQLAVGTFEVAQARASFNRAIAEGISR